MRIESSPTPVTGSLVTSRSTEPVESFASLLASGQTTQAIATGRAFGFAETGMFGALGALPERGSKPQSTNVTVEEANSQAILKEPAQSPPDTSVRLQTAERNDPVYKSVVPNALEAEPQVPATSLPQQVAVTANPVTQSAQSEVDRSKLRGAVIMSQLTFDWLPGASKSRKTNISVNIDQDMMDVSVLVDDDVTFDQTHLNQEIVQLSYLYRVTLRRLAVIYRKSA